MISEASNNVHSNLYCHPAPCSIMDYVGITALVISDLPRTPRVVPLRVRGILLAADVLDMHTIGVLGWLGPPKMCPEDPCLPISSPIRILPNSQLP
jgi:hypothetical protein